MSVLAIYILTLLAPIHHAAWLQKDFAKLGYEAVGAWSVCTAINDTDSNQDAPAAVHCPVAGIAKAQIAADMDVGAVGAPLLASSDFRPVHYAANVPSVPPGTQSRPRAPPLTV